MPSGVFKPEADGAELHGAERGYRGERLRPVHQQIQGSGVRSGGISVDTGDSHQPAGNRDGDRHGDGRTDRDAG